jgi:hypothetical protein
VRLTSTDQTKQTTNMKVKKQIELQVKGPAPVSLRIGQTVSVAISHGAQKENTRVIQ